MLCPFLRLCRQGIYGENIAASIAADTDPVRTATGLWIGEAADYDYDSPVGGEFRASVIILTCLTRC
jgi:hypothetical protein